MKKIPTKFIGKKNGLLGVGVTGKNGAMAVPVLLVSKDGESSGSAVHAFVTILSVLLHLTKSNASHRTLLICV